MNLDPLPQFGERLSILLLGTQIAVGGAQRVLLDQADLFHANGHKVAVAFLYDRDGLHSQWQQAYPFTIHNLEAFDRRSGLWWRLLSLMGGLVRLWKLLRRNAFDVVETFTLDSNLFALPVAWMAGVPVRVATNHGFAKSDSRLKRRMHSFLINLRIASVLICVTEQIRLQSIQEGVNPDYVLSIPNGIRLLQSPQKNPQALFRALNISGNAVFLLAVGRLVHEKAHDVLIRAMRLVVDEYPGVVLGVAGSGELREDLDALVEKLGLGDHVRILGNRDDIAFLMANADIFVMPSRSEGMPMALLEAMAAGLPIIATTVGGLPEVLPDPSQGLLVPPENPTELATALLQLLRDPEKRAQMGKAARARVSQGYSLQHMYEKYLNVMEKYLGRSHT